MVRITIALILALSTYDVLANDSRLQACVKAYTGKKCPRNDITIGRVRIESHMDLYLSPAHASKYCKCREAYAPKKSHYICLAWSRACEFGDI